MVSSVATPSEPPSIAKVGTALAVLVTLGGLAVSVGQVLGRVEQLASEVRRLADRIDGQDGRDRAFWADRWPAVERDIATIKAEVSALKQDAAARRNGVK